MIHFAQTGTPRPFDTIGYRAITEDITDWHGIERAREQLRKAATAIRKPDYKVSNPITQANASFQMQESADPKDRLLVHLGQRIDQLERLLSPSVDLILSEADWDHSKRKAMADILLSNKGISIRDGNHRPVSFKQLVDKYVKEKDAK